ncbi:DNA polymerase III subunit delta' [Corynebacterium sp. S7]
MNTRSVSQRLADSPTVRDTILSAARAARGEHGADAHAMTHSWLFTGPPGSGRSNSAVAFAAALVCTDPNEPGCGRCQSCLDAFGDSHTDIVHVVPQELSISIDTVRNEIIAPAARLPTIAKWRVVIVEDADRLSPPARDALLKTVEEPPASTVIILCAPSTDPKDFSPTLRSRCRHLYIPQPSMREVMRILMEEEGASESDAQLAAATSLRHIGRARALIKSEAIQKRRAQVIQLAELIFHGDQSFQAVGALLTAIKKESEEAHAEQDTVEREKLEQSLGMGAKGKGAARALSGASKAVKDLEAQQKKRGTRRQRDAMDLALVDFAGVYRDALIIKAGSQLQLTHPDFEGLSREIAEKVSVEGLVACQDAIEKCRVHISQSVGPQTAFFGMIGAIRKACKVK